jgi:hypothetical protein
VSTVPRHSEEELRQQWAFLDALVDRQASSLRAGSQDPEEEDLPPVVAPAETTYLEEISTLTRRVSTLESERTTLLRRLDLAEEARMASEEAREAAEAGRVAAEHALAAARVDAEDIRIAQGLPAAEVAREPDHDIVLETPSTEPSPLAVEPAAEEPPATAAEPAPVVTREEPPVAVGTVVSPEEPQIAVATVVSPEWPPVAVATVAAEKPIPVADAVAVSEPQVVTPQERATATVAPSKPRRKTWWQRLRG